MSNPLPRTQEVKSSDNALSHVTQAQLKPRCPTVQFAEPKTKRCFSDESQPKSTPRHQADQYVRKRMRIAGATYCDAAVLKQLTVGTYFDLVSEPENPYDKNAVKLLWNGKKIGYVPKADNLAFVASLRLKRRLYGVITEINTDTSPTQYEFEAWVDRGEH